jgi:hypothetical protein
MRKKVFGWLTRIKAVEREHTVTRLAMDRLDQQAQDNPAVLAGNLEYRDVRVASEQLDGTYIIRLFAEFETSLRHFMRDLGYREPRRAETLIDRIRDRANMSNDDAKSAQGVREYRNALVHDRMLDVKPISVRDATKYLATFLGWLQRLW